MTYKEFAVKLTVEERTKELARLLEQRKETNRRIAFIKKQGA